MNDKVFFDTNILVYSYSFTELDKQRISRKLIEETDSYISTQVLQELVNTLTKKFGKSWNEAKKVVDESCKNNIVFSNQSKTISGACSIADKYQYSFYDSLIISAALSCKCKILFSEDFQHGQVIEDNLKIVNPFF
ncbi:MAG: PIN domain-containing protein [Mariniphaga sp.]|jgi:predicted nucleic acid-binding protein|nr:PIN domain-containing protein [Mariniphaga sp.]